MPDEIRNASSQDLWGALVAAAPELGLAVAKGNPSNLFRYSDRPGFREWLIAQFAINNPPALVRDHLAEIVDEQENAGLALTWPRLGKRQLETARRDLRDEWLPYRQQLQDKIAQVGIANKQARLLAYQGLVEELSDRMWTERNDKTGQLYLQRTYLDTLRAVAEEMGDLGSPVDGNIEGLVEIAKELVQVIKVQGAGLQEHTQTVDDFDYETGRPLNEATTVRREGTDVQEDGLQA